MMARAIVSSVMLFLLTASAGAELPTVLHEPVTAATVGQSITVSLSLSELGSQDPPLVTLFYRGLSQEGFASVVMRAAQDGRYVAAIPERVTQDLGLEYYMQVSEDGQSPSLALGSEARPFRVNLISPPEPSRALSVLLIWGGLSSVALVIGLVIRSSGRRRRAWLEERLFWIKILTPLIDCPSAQATRDITRLSSTPLNHPVKGLCMFPRNVILRKLREVKELDVTALLRECDSQLAPGFERPSAPRTESTARRADGSRSSTRLKAV